MNIIKHTNKLICPYCGAVAVKRYDDDSYFYFMQKEEEEHGVEQHCFNCFKTFYYTAGYDGFSTETVEEFYKRCIKEEEEEKEEYSKELKVAKKEIDEFFDHICDSSAADIKNLKHVWRYRLIYNENRIRENEENIKEFNEVLTKEEAKDE